MYMCVLSHVWLSVTLGSPPGSSVKGISQAQILEWVVMPSSRGSSQPRNQTHTYPSLLHCRWILYCWATRDAQCCPYIRQNLDTGIHMGDSLLRRRVTQSLPSSSFGIPIRMPVSLYKAKYGYRHAWRAPYEDEGRDHFYCWSDLVCVIFVIVALKN